MGGKVGGSRSSSGGGIIEPRLLDPKHQIMVNLKENRSPNVGSDKNANQ